MKLLDSLHGGLVVVRWENIPTTPLTSTPSLSSSFCVLGVYPLQNMTLSCSTRSTRIRHANYTGMVVYPCNRTRLANCRRRHPGERNLCPINISLKIWQCFQTKFKPYQRSCSVQFDAGRFPTKSENFPHSNIFAHSSCACRRVYIIYDRYICMYVAITFVTFLYSKFHFYFYFFITVNSH